MYFQQYRRKRHDAQLRLQQQVDSGATPEQRELGQRWASVEDAALALHNLVNSEMRRWRKNGRCGEVAVRLAAAFVAGLSATCAELDSEDAVVGTAAAEDIDSDRPQRSKYRLPRGCTPRQQQVIEGNPSGLLGRFGLCVLPTNTWQCSGKEFESQENEWRARGIDDRDRQSEATLGALHTFATTYGKGNAQKHSDFKSVICQRVYTTFKLRDPGEEWWLDISCGGKHNTSSKCVLCLTCSTFCALRRCYAAACCWNVWFEVPWSGPAARVHHSWRTTGG